MANQRRATILIGALALAVTLAGCSSGGDNATPTGSTDPTRSATAPPTGAPQSPSPEISMIGSDFPQILSGESFPTPTPEAIAEFGEETAIQGAHWAIGLAQQTAYDTNLWEKVTAPGANLDSLTSDDYLPYSAYMTPAGMARWITAINGETLKDPVNGPGSFVLLPTIKEGYEWRPPSMRPNDIPATGGGFLPADSFDVKEIGVGAPESSYSARPTLKVVFDDYHVYEFTINGEPHAVQVKRPWTMFLAKSEDPEHPWLLEDWAIGPIESRTVATLQESGAPAPTDPSVAPVPPIPDGFDPSGIPG